MNKGEGGMKIKGVGEYQIWDSIVTWGRPKLSNKYQKNVKGTSGVRNALYQYKWKHTISDVSYQLDMVQDNQII